jgi:hypothetical protein
MDAYEHEANQQIDTVEMKERGVPWLDNVEQH